MGDLSKKTIDYTAKCILEIRKSIILIENHCKKIRANCAFGDDYIHEIIKSAHIMEELILKTNATFYAITPVIRDHKDQLDELDKKTTEELLDLVDKAFRERYKGLGEGLKQKIPNAGLYLTRDKFFTDFKENILDNIKENKKYIVKASDNTIENVIK